MEIAWILGGLFLFCTMGFVVVAVFLPELVGIQGRKSQEIEAQHRSTAPRSEESPHKESQTNETPQKETQDQETQDQETPHKESQQKETPQ